jgi:two-component system KDP operon response regulator KdpE
LLRVLVQHAGKVLTHQFLLKELWDELTDANICASMSASSARRSSDNPEQPQYIHTETGVGYRLREGDIRLVRRSAAR